eukprot:scaffold20759_cov70-Attheya_sp.AAC.3
MLAEARAIVWRCSYKEDESDCIAVMTRMMPTKEAHLCVLVKRSTHECVYFKRQNMTLPYLTMEISLKDSERSKPDRKRSN